MHMVGESSAGIILRYLSKFSETAPRLPTTTGTTIHSVSHIRPSSSRNPLYLVIFSCSLSDTLMSFGQDMSIMRVFLPFLSRITMSGRLNTYGLSVDIIESHIISVFLSDITSGGLCVCHLAVVWNSKFLHIAWWTYCATPLCVSRYYFFASESHPESICDIFSLFFMHTLQRSLACFLSMWRS